MSQNIACCIPIQLSIAQTSQNSDDTDSDSETGLSRSHVNKNLADERTPGANSTVNRQVDEELQQEMQERKQIREEGIELICKEANYVHLEVLALMNQPTGLSEELERQFEISLKKIQRLERQLADYQVDPTDPAVLRKRVHDVVINLQTDEAWLEKKIVENQRIRATQFGVPISSTFNSEYLIEPIHVLSTVQDRIW